jgi:hypothetical protein
MFKKLAMFAFDKMKQLELNVQQAIIEKFLVHPLMQNMIPNYLTNLQCLKAHEEVLSDLKSGITYHLTNQQKAQVVVAKDIVCMLALG